MVSHMNPIEHALMSAVLLHLAQHSQNPALVQGLSARNGRLDLDHAISALREHNNHHREKLLSKHAPSLSRTQRVTAALEGGK